MKAKLLLGVDGGGTNTIAWLADTMGNVLGRGRSGPSNVKAVGAEQAERSLRESIAAAHREAGTGDPASVEVACLGLAGFDRPDDRRLLQQWAESHAWGRRLILVNDGELLLAAGTPEGWGVGVIAGTGSIAVGRSADGRAVRAGGWGPLFGDEGSAYSVAVSALRWIARQADGRDAPAPARDRLSPYILEHLGLEQPSQLVSALYASDVNRTRIAQLAPVVVAAAEEGSQAAEEILAHAAEELALAALAVAKGLGFVGQGPARPFPLVLAGGFLLANPKVAGAVESRLVSEGAKLTTITPVPDPVFGALTLARRSLEV